MSVIRRRLSARDRLACFEAADGICDICSTKIMPGQDWEVSHRIPLAMGGEDTPANRFPVHARCHAEQTAKHDAPRIAKTRRQRQKHIGAKPKSARPVPGSRNTPWRRRMDGTTERRT